MPQDVRRELESGVLSRVPLGRVGSADEAAAVAVFLLSYESSYVTGS
jgi:NAD(P)-dependent dehydrogenase (short-subunit alcohol dehydrogenase family)